MDKIERGERHFWTCASCGNWTIDIGRVPWLYLGDKANDAHSWMTEHAEQQGCRNAWRVTSAVVR